MVLGQTPTEPGPLLLETDGGDRRPRRRAGVLISLLGAAVIILGLFDEGFTLLGGPALGGVLLVIGGFLISGRKPSRSALAVVGFWISAIAVLLTVVSYLPAAFLVDAISIWGGFLLGILGAIVSTAALLWRGSGPRSLAWIGLILGLLPVVSLVFAFAALST